ncbi:hypothetical protein Acr_10g0008190 [Actinidia rufa]|uniref:Reverse transcriptase domain-containing protein n=1 Tax=Actinidia rufa TaxID=165716 RepID=A0A7J0F9Q5_9ERIC|nr:hypothetical protein Acr_10g0008190 [Actinidia rufa]
MHPSNVEKTSFITERGLYCYKVMPLGLKNAKMMYQRLVNKMFKEMIGEMMKVYIDDMLVKSLKPTDHIAHLEEMFGVLWRHRMMLNPSKCIFGVCLGKFLGFLVTKCGIEANPNQIEALFAMSSPKNIHELKEYLGSPSLLTVPNMAEELILYLSISPTAMSVVLIREEDKVQNSVYYVSKVLMGIETRTCSSNSQTPSGEHMEYAIHIEFRATNNEAEYEAFLAGLRVATELRIPQRYEAEYEAKNAIRKKEVDSLDAFSDS